MRLVAITARNTLKVKSRTGVDRPLPVRNLWREVTVVSRFSGFRVLSPALHRQQPPVVSASQLSVLSPNPLHLEHLSTRGS